MDELAPEPDKGINASGVLGSSAHWSGEAPSSPAGVRKRKEPLTCVIRDTSEVIDVASQCFQMS